MTDQNAAASSAAFLFWLVVSAVRLEAGGDALHCTMIEPAWCSDLETALNNFYIAPDRILIWRPSRPRANLTGLRDLSGFSHL